MRLACSSASGPLAFEDPEECIVARAPGEIEAAFDAIDRALRRGRYVAGFMSYELGAALVPKQPSAAAGRLPLLAMGVFDRARGALAPAGGDYTLGPLAPAVSAARYRADIAAILSLVREGDVYQVNYAAPFEFAFRGEPQALFEALAAGGSYPHAAYVEFEDLAIVSCSPELFVRFAGERIVTKPMKGTAEPGDLAALANEKNRAEHVMIVDLMRNDLHRLGAEATVERLLEVETYPTYATMTSTISTPVQVQRPFGEIAGALFPSGSVTGAPKVTAMQAIASTERRPRGIFCGSVGYLGPDRTGSWNVAIRTAEIDRRAGRGVLHVGGGIVADSDARTEWAEIVTKRRVFDVLTPQYALFETLRREENGTYRDLEAHLARLERSADALHFTCDPAALRRALAGIATPGPRVVRLELRTGGTIAVAERDPAPPSAAGAVCWAPSRLDPSELLLRHKTTWRPVHDEAARAAEARGCVDALLLDERDQLCDGARTSVFIEREGALLTPPLEAGALPGILRGQLLAAGRARERTLSRTDVETAPALFVGNSVRGLLPVRLDAAKTAFAYAR